MKKVLFATTALVLSAGVAAAEVSVGGNGRMGFVYDGNNFNFSSRARVEFTLSGQTDGGLDFGGFFRANDASDAASGTAGSVYVSGSFGKIEMGDVVSAPEALFGDLPEVGFQDLASTEGTGWDNDIPYLTLDDGTQSALLYTYSVGGLSVAASLTDGTDNGAKDNSQYGAAVSYTFSNYTIGIGYENVDYDGAPSESQTEIAGTATFGDTSVKAYYAVGGGDNWLDQGYGIGVSSKFGATTVMGYAQTYEGIDGVDDAWWGLGASYDLGGGASIAGGISGDDIPGNDLTADLGLKFTF